MASDNVDEQTLHLTVRLRAEEEKTEEEEEEIGGLINSDGEAEEWSGGDRLTGPSDAADQPQNIQTKESPTLATKDDETSEKKTSRGQRARDSKPPVDEKKHVGETIKRETRARKPVNYQEQTEEFEPQTARQLRRRTTSLKKEDNNNATQVCKAAGKKHPGRKMLSVPLVIPPELLKVPKEKMKYQCSVCGKEFPHAYKLERHELIHTGEKPYCCSICGRGFNQKGNLKTHYKVHLGHNSAVDIELEVNPVASQLTEYLKTLPGESRLKTLSDCLECERDLEYQSDLRAHHLTGHSVTAADSSKHNSALFFFCRRCGIKFSEREKLAEHMKTHVKEKPYSCPDCGKRFINESYVHVHQRIHTGEKPFLCSQCGRGFHTATSLKMHEMQHTGEKPFVCSMCGKRFRMNSYLTAHYQTHMNDRPFICGVCGKGYSRAEELKVHNRLHTGERPYECDVCSKSFIYRQGLRQHQRTHTGPRIGPTRQLGRPKQHT